MTKNGGSSQAMDGLTDYSSSALSATPASLKVSASVHERSHRQRSWKGAGDNRCQTLGQQMMCLPRECATHPLLHNAIDIQRTRATHQNEMTFLQTRGKIKQFGTESKSKAATEDGK
mmetsp:Transcript_51134/g.100469  ORF Transcript_51134/g.100469 Transcript_51134/m.100469 type:complete len:117 (+) Transcript_51134:752-1102(+)